jgi:hypothetical protein
MGVRNARILHARATTLLPKRTKVMPKTSLTLVVLATPLVSMLCALPAQAQRVFVAAQGSNSNPCTFALPCRTFQQAHDVVASGGEIDVLDPAGYGALTISKAISIQGHGFSGITATIGNAITINGGSTDRINLNGLIIEGFATGNNGIVFNTGAALNIQDSTIRGFTNTGVRFAPSAFMVAAATFIRIEVDNNNIGIAASNSPGVTSYVSLIDSVVSNNGTGIDAFSDNFQTAVMVRNSTISNNGLGINAHGSGTPGTGGLVTMGHSVIAANATGWSFASGGIVGSYGDNQGNRNVNASPTPVAASPF